MRRYASLRRRRDFARLRQRGRRTATAHFTLYRDEAAPEGGRPQVGISVSKDVGGAVVRNRVRRRVSATLHELLSAESCMRLLVVARPAAAGLAYAALHDELRGALA